MLGVRLGGEQAVTYDDAAIDKSGTSPPIE